MNTVKRVFNLATRTLKSPQGKCYVGQVYDHISTTLEFSYDPINVLDGDVSPYLVFDLRDEEGNLFVYGLGSAPRFDGYTFEIPTSITSRIRSGRVDYQLWIVHNRDGDWDGRIETLGDTEYIFSAKDTLAFKESLRCRQPRNDCAPPQPCLEPGTLGWLTYLRNKAILTPVKESYGKLSDGTEGVTLDFSTYNEVEDAAVELKVPFLTNGKLDINRFIDVINNWKDAKEGNIASALKIQLALNTKLDKDSIVDTWEQEVVADDEDGLEIDPMRRVPSRELVYESLSYKTDKWMAVPEWDATVQYSTGSTVVFTDVSEEITAPNVYIALKPSLGVPPTDKDAWSTISEHDMIIHDWSEMRDDREQVPSAELAKETLDSKVDDSQVIGDWADLQEQEVQIPSATLMWDSLAEKVDDAQIVQVLDGEGTPEDIPSTQLMKELLDLKTDKDMAVPEWDADTVYHKGSTVISRENFLFISTTEGNRGNPPYMPGTEEYNETGYSDWAPIRGAGSSLEEGDTTTLAQVIGDGETRDFTIHHTFNTNNVFVQVRTQKIKKVGEGENEHDVLESSYLVDALVDVTSSSQVKVIFNEPPEPKGAVVYISPGGGRDVGSINDDGSINDGFVLFSTRNQANGYAGLDENKKVPYPNLPVVGSWDHVKDPALKIYNAKVVKEQVGKRTQKKYFDKWDPAGAYVEGSVVTHKGLLYISRYGNDQVSNLNIDPSTDDGTHWTAVITDVGNSTVVRRSIRFGNDTDTEYEIPHGLKSYDFIYSLRTADSSHRYINDAEVYAKSMDIAKVVLKSPPGVNGMVMNLVDCMTHRMSAVELSEFVEPTAQWIYPNTSGNPVFVQTFDSEGNLIKGDAIQNSDSGFDPVSISFGEPLAGTMIVAKGDLVLPFTSEDLVFNEAMDEWQYSIPRTDETRTPYAVQVFLDGTGEAMANIEQSLDLITIGFETQELSGFIILKKATEYKVFTDETEWTLEHSRGRLVGVQVYFEDGGQAFPPMTSSETKVEVFLGGQPRPGILVLI